MKIREKPIPPRIHSLHGAGGALAAHSRPTEHQSPPPRNRKATFPDTLEHRANRVKPPAEQDIRRQGGIDKDMTVGSTNLVSSSRPMEPTGSPTTNKPSPNHRIYQEKASHLADKDHPPPCGRKGDLPPQPYTRPPRHDQTSSSM